MQSVDTSLNDIIHAHQPAHTMYKALKDLHNVSGHDTLRKTWGTFVDLRPEDCKSIQDYIGRFKNTLADLSNAGACLRYKRSSVLKYTPDSNEELMTTAFVQGLHHVVPDWCEARENDLHQGKIWAMDKLVASLNDHIRHSNNSTDLLKSFTAIAKQDEEKRVLTRMANRAKDSSKKTHGGNISSKSTSSTAQNKKGKDGPPVEWCDNVTV